jgi:hypothetical protein
LDADYPENGVLIPRLITPKGPIVGCGVAKLERRERVYTSWRKL